MFNISFLENFSISLYACTDGVVKPPSWEFFIISAFIIFQYFCLYCWCYEEYISVRNSPTKSLYFLVQNNSHPQIPLKTPTFSFPLIQILKIEWFVWLATTYWCSNISDNVLKNSISCGPRPAISYFQTKCDNVITCMGKNLLLNRINRGSVISLYRKKVVIL